VNRHSGCIGVLRRQLPCIQLPARQRHITACAGHAVTLCVLYLMRQLGGGTRCQLVLCQQVWLAVRCKGPCLCDEHCCAYRFICASLSAFCAAAKAAIACTCMRHKDNSYVEESAKQAAHTHDAALLAASLNHAQPTRTCLTLF
jgi:hypothetical protein